MKNKQIRQTLILTSGKVEISTSFLLKTTFMLKYVYKQYFNILISYFQLQKLRELAYYKLWSKKYGYKYLLVTYNSTKFKTIK